MEKDILNKTLITGGNGTVASYIDFGTKVDRNIFDITNLTDTVEFIKKVEPKVILHLAAETDMKRCEEDPAHAYLVNSVGTYNLSLAAKEVGAKFVYVSTDAVFPNSKSTHSIEDRENPQSVYGHSKYLGELAVKGMSEDYIIVRTSWVFGGGKEKDKKFVAKFIKELDKSEAKAVDDEFNSPTYALDLVGVLKTIILENHSGISHIANSGSASRYDMALVMAEVLNKKIKIIPVQAETFGLLPYQQSSGGLIGSIALRSWQEALKDYLKTEWV